MNHPKCPSLKKSCTCALAGFATMCLACSACCSANAKAMVGPSLPYSKVVLSSHNYPFITNVDSNNFNKVVEDTKQPVVILVVDGWSGQSNREQDEFVNMASKFHTFARFVIINSQNSPELMKKLNCSQAPSVYFIPATKEISCVAGFQNTSQLTNEIESFLFGRENLIINPQSLSINHN